MATIDITVGDETHTLPARYEVCWDCQGEGRTWPESLRGDSIRVDDADDREFAEDLMAGRYNVTCKTCKGRTTVLAVDEDALSPEQLEVYIEYQSARAEEAAYHAEEAHLRRAEGGW